MYFFFSMSFIHKLCPCPCPQTSILKSPSKLIGSGVLRRQEGREGKEKVRSCLQGEENIFLMCMTNISDSIFSRHFCLSRI